MRCCKFKFELSLKKVLASFLSLTMLGFQANLMSFAETNITGVTGNNGIYDIRPTGGSGNTGFRHYTDFSLGEGHTANLIFEYQNNPITRFINAVDNKVTINGILNSVNGNGAFANGRAIFVSPSGFVVGASGVVNVGSLDVYTPSISAYDSFKNLSVENMTDALLNSDAYYGNGSITINGMILTREGMTLKDKNITFGNGNDIYAKTAHGFTSSDANYSQEGIASAANSDIARANADALFNMLVNVGKGNTDSRVTFGADKKGNVSIVMKDGARVRTTNLNMVANGDVKINMELDPEFITNREAENYARSSSEYSLNGEIYSTGKFDFTYALDEATQKEKLIERFGEGLSEHDLSNLYVKNSFNVNGVISAKDVSIENNAVGGSGLFVNDNAIIKASNTMDLVNNGGHFALFGTLKLDNVDNNENALINITNNISKYQSKSGGMYLSGNIESNNASLNILNFRSSGAGGASPLSLGSDGKINVTNGDINITQKAGSFIIDEGNSIKISDNGNLSINNIEQCSRILLKGDIDVAGDVSLYVGESIDNNSGDIFVLGNIKSGNNVSILNETNSRSIIVNSIIDSNNDIKISNSENAASIVINGTLSSANGDIVLEHNGNGKYNTNEADIYSCTQVTIVPGSNNSFEVFVTRDKDGEYVLDSYTYDLIGGEDNANSLYIGDNAVIKTDKGSITLSHSSTNGGIVENGSVYSSNDLNIINSGNKGIALNRDITALNKTYIYDNGISDITLSNVLNTGSLEIQNHNSGNIDINSVINANGNALVQNNTTGKIDISGTLNNSSTSGTTKIVNEATNTGGINIVGTVGAKNATTITNNGDSLINITGDVVDNIAGITIEQTNAGENGGIYIAKDIATDGYLTIDNNGQKGITLNDGVNTSSKGKTTIKDTSNVAININSNSKIEAGALEINKEGKGGINLNGTVNSTGDTLVVNYGTDSINIANTFAGGKTTIYNDVNGDDINISGSMTTNGDTMIVQGGSGILNITNSLNNNSIGGETIISNVNGTGLNVANITTNGFTVLENASNGNITINGNINANNGDLSIQNQNYQIAINKTGSRDSDAIVLSRQNSDASSKDGGIVANGSLSANSVYVQNSGDQGIEINGNIDAVNSAWITADNAGINLKGDEVSANTVLISASNNSTDGININSNVISDNVMLIENAGSGDIVINGNLNGNDGLVMIENQTYDITTPRVLFIDNDSHVALNVYRAESESANVNGGIVTSGSISGGEIYIQNSGAKGITTNSDITSQGDIMITNNAGNINLKGANIDGYNVLVSNSNQAGALNIDSDIYSNAALIENAGNGDMTINGDVLGGLVSLQNQTYDISTPQFKFDNGLIILDVNRSASSNSSNKGNALITNGSLVGSDVYVQNSGNGGIKSNGDIQALYDLMITNNGGGINLEGENISGTNVTITSSNKATGGININSDVESNNLMLIENAGKGDIVVNGNLTGNDGIIMIENQTYDIETPLIFDNSSGIIRLGVNRSDSASANVDGGIIANGNILSNSLVYIQNAGQKGITTSNNIVGYEVYVTNDKGSINLNDGTIFGNNIIISNSNNANELKVNADVEALNLALIENAGSGDMILSGDISGSLVSLQNQTYDIETPRYVISQDDSLILLDINRIDSSSKNSNGGIIASGNISGGEVYIQNAGEKGITTSGNISGTSNVTVTNDSGNINLASGTINSSNVIVSNSNNANELKIGANIQSDEGIVLIENAGSGNMIVNGNINGNSLVLLENQTYDIVTPRISGNGLIMLDVNRIDSPSANTNSGLIVNGDIQGKLVYIQNSGDEGITTNSNITSQGDVMITNNGGNINLGEGNISGENIIVSNSNQAGALTSNSNINASNLALIENSGNGDMTVNGDISGVLVSLQNQTYNIDTPRVVTQSNGLITLGVNRSDADSVNKGNTLVTNGTLTGQDVYVQNSGNGGIKSNSDINAQYDVMITNNGGSINLESGNISGKNVTVSNSNQANGGILVGANVNTQREGKLVVENAAPGSITLNGNLNSNGGYIIVENQTYDIETPRVVYGDFILLDVNRINQPSQYVDGGIIANGTINGGDVFIQNAGSQGITINNDIVSDNLMVTNDNGGINIGNVNLTAQHRDIIISNSSNATSGINIAANVDAGGDVVVENSGNGNIQLTETSSLSGQRVLVENQTYDIETPRVPEGGYILLGVERNENTSPNLDGGIIANGNITGTDEVYIQNSGNNGITTNGDVTGGDVAITNNGGSINLNNGTIIGDKVIVTQSNQGEGGVTIGSNILGNDLVLIENAGSGNITIGGNIDGTKISIQNQTYDIETPQFKHNDGLITLNVNRIDSDSPNRDGGIIANGNITGTDEVYIQNSGNNGITTNGDVTGGDVAITNNGGSINLNNGTIIGDKVIVTQSNQGEGGVTIGSNILGNDLVLIENAGSDDITIGGNIDGTKISIQNQTYDIETPRNVSDNPYITLDVNRIDQDSPNRDGGIIIDGDITGSEDIKIQNSGDDGITTNGDVTGGDVAITNNGGDVNINGDVDGDDVTISNSDNGGEVNINGNVDGNDVLVENNGSGNINNPGNVNGDVKDHEYGIETPRNTDDVPYISLDVERRPFPPTPQPDPVPTPVIRDNDPTRLIYDKKREDNFLELKRESIRYGINGDSLSLNSASSHIEKILDISKTGLAVKTDGSLKINDEVKVNFAYKGIEVEATAKVMRVNKSTNVAGLKFIDLDNLTANKILYLSMLIESQREQEQTAQYNQNQQPSFMNVLTRM